MLIVEPRMVIIFWTHNPIFKHMSFWNLSLEPDQATYYLNISVLIRKSNRIRVVYLKVRMHVVDTSNFMYTFSH